MTVLYPAHEKNPVDFEDEHKFCRGVIHYKAAGPKTVLYKNQEEVAMIITSGKGDSKCNDCQESVLKSIQMPEGRLQ